MHQHCHLLAFENIKVIMEGFSQLSYLELRVRSCKVSLAEVRLTESKVQERPVLTKYPT